MKVRSSASAMIAPTMAFKTKAAGPSLQSFSKMDPIAQSETRVRAVLCSLLIAGEARHVLPRGNLKFQSAAIGLGRKTADLIHDRKILRARRKENVSRQACVSPTRQRKSKPRNSGGPPLCACSGESAVRTCGRNRESPFLRKVQKCRAS